MMTPVGKALLTTQRSRWSARLASRPIAKVHFEAPQPELPAMPQAEEAAEGSTTPVATTPTQEEQDMLELVGKKVSRDISKSLDEAKVHST